MKALSEKLRDTEYNGQAMTAKLLAEAAQYIDGLDGDYANLKAERDTLSAELAALREQEPLQPSKYWHDGDIGYDFPDDFELIGEAKIGDLFVISEAYYFPATYKVTREYNEDGDIDPEVEKISGINIYGDVGHDASITDAELKLIMDMRAIKEKHINLIASVDVSMDKGEAVFAAPKEDFRAWPEDHGEHPQRGVVK